MSHLTGRTVVFLTSARGIEEVELTEPWRVVEEHGGTPLLAAPERGRVGTVTDDLGPGRSYPVDRTHDEVAVADLDLLVLPGGTVNADALRLEQAAVSLVRAVAEAGKPIAAICHGPWALVEADQVHGKALTSYPSLATDVRNAGGSWEDRAVVVDHEGYPLVTSRGPGDLRAFTSAIIEIFN